MKAEIRSEEPLDVTAPGALPFIDFEISEFDELVAATEQISTSRLCFPKLGRCCQKLTVKLKCAPIFYLSREKTTKDYDVW